MLGHEDQRRLDEIELCIVSEDPRFARRMQRLEARGQQGARQQSMSFWWWWLFAMGVALSLSAIFRNPAIMIVAVVMSTGIVMARWLPSRLR